MVLLIIRMHVFIGMHNELRKQVDKDSNDAISSILMILLDSINSIQLTPVNSNLQGKMKKVRRVIGSSSYRG